MIYRLVLMPLRTTPNSLGLTCKSTYLSKAEQHPFACPPTMTPLSFWNYNLTLKIPSLATVSIKMIRFVDQFEVQILIQ